MPYIGKKPADIIATAVDTTTGDFSGNVTAGGTLGVTGETTLATHLNLGDSDKIKLGASGDLEIYHDGSNSHIDDTGTGVLILRGNSKVELQKYTGEVMLTANADGAVELYNNDSKKFETTSGGATVTGNTATDTLSVGTTSTNGTLTITGSIVARETDGQFEIISRDTSGSSSTDYGDIIFKGQRSVDGDTVTIMTLDGASGAVAITGATSIGTSTPDGLLTLEGTSNPLARFTHTQNADEVVLILQHAYATGSQPASMIQFRDTGGTVRGSIQTTGSATSYITSSDYRLKENVVTEWDATTRLKQLKPSRFNFIEDADNTVDGFLAHEVSSIVPEAITGDKDGTRDIGTIKDEDNNVIKENAYESEKKEKQTWEKTGTENVYQGIDQSKLVPLLTKALQEQQATIEALTARITALESA